MKKTFISEDAAISSAKIQAENNPVLVIYTHGHGHEIVSNDFKTDRLYYHGEGGQKMFFTPIAYVHPAGIIKYLDR